MVEEQQGAPVQSLSPKKMFFSGALAVLAVFLVGAAMVGFRATRNLSEGKAVTQFAKVFGIAVARVNGISIPYADYVHDVTLLKKFYAEQGEMFGPVSPDDISDQVLSRLVVNALIMDYAKKYRITVSDQEVQSSPFLAKLIAPFGTREAADEEMQKRYGLTFDEYVTKVVRPVIVEEKLQEAFSTATDEAGKPYEEEQVRARHILFQVADAKDDAKVKKEAGTVLKRIQQGEDFATLAKEFGSDGTKDTGGDLGWFGRGRMVPEFEAAAFAAEPGALISELVKTDFGYHIVKVEEKRMARNYSAFMGDQLKIARVDILIPKVHNPFTPTEGSGEFEGTDFVTSTEDKTCCVIIF